MIGYSLKRVIRSWRLFAALLIGMTLAATFYGGINIGADTIAKQFLDRQLERTPVDVRVQPSNRLSFDLQNYVEIRDEIGSIDGVAKSEVRSGFSASVNTSSPFPDVLVHALMDASTVYDDAFISGSQVLGANETYVVEGSPLAADLVQGQQITLYVSRPSDPPPLLRLNLTFAGTVTLSERAQAILNIYFGGDVFVAPSFSQNIFLTSWEKTLVPIMPLFGCIQEFQTYVCRALVVPPNIDVYLDRERLINVFDIESSISNIQRVVARIQNVAAREGLIAYPAIAEVLQQVAFPSFILRVFYVIVSLPVFFIAWYMGGTVSQSSLNLRRREIGLLLVKGATKGQLARIFLGEALLIGSIGGVIGVALAVALNPLFVATFGGQQSSIFLSRDTVIITIVFTIILTLLSVWRPARRAASLNPLDALREYVYVEEVKGYKQTRPVIAFSLGLYKVILLLLGINFLTIAQFARGGQSAFVSLALIILTFLDFVLTFIGPFLFFWGASRIFAGGSSRFQAFIARFGRRILGELSQVASKNVYRNPARVAAITFLLALISGYGVWVTGQFASIQDQSVRQVFASVGADISIATPNASSALVLSNQLSSWNNVTAATPEIALPFTFGSETRAIDPLGWRSAAYHEPEWFTGQNEDSIFIELNGNPRTIILNKGIASQLRLDVGDSFTLTLSGGASYSMRVVGFFGPDTTQAQVLGGPSVIPSFGGGWSYVSLQFWQSLSVQSVSSSRVLVDAAENVNATLLGRSIREQPTASQVSVAEDELARRESAPGADIFQGILDVFRLGTVFAGLAASVGVGTVTYTSFREREKETTIMAVRGVSYKQLLGILLMESLPIVLFSLALGTTVGVINVRGNALSLNSLFLGQSFQAALTPYQVVFPTWVLLTLLGIFASILLAVVVPALLEARKSSEKMTRMVRLG